MRKIYIIEESINKMGGVERIVSFLANNFAEECNNVNVISIFKDGNEPFFKYNKSINIYYFCNRKKDNLRINNRLLYIKNLFKIRNFCKNIDNNSVIIFGRTSVATKFLPFIKNNPLIIVRDAINYWSHSPIEKKIMIKYFPMKVNTFIVSSDESKEGYEKYFNFSNIRMIKIYNPLAIDTSKSEKYSFENKEILSVGRFDVQKGFENLIRAFSFVAKKHNDWTLRIVGDGNLREKYKELILSLNLQENVILDNSSKCIEKIYSEASIFVLTSRYEGYANALVEALACGLPSISYDWLSGVEEIIQDGLNGKIVKLSNRFDYYNGIDAEDDIFNLANAINEIIENKKMAYSMHNEAVKISNSRNSSNIFAYWKDLINDNES